MLRALLRLAGLVCLAGAFAAAVVDGAQSIAASKLALTPLGSMLYRAFPEPFAKLQPFVEREIHPFVWNPLLVDILLAPAFLVLAILGLFLFYLAKPPAPLIGHSNRPR